MLWVEKGRSGRGDKEGKLLLLIFRSAGNNLQEIEIINYE